MPAAVRGRHRADRRSRTFGQDRLTATRAGSGRSYVTAGMALVGASAISISPITPSIAATQPEVRTATAQVNLAAQSVMNVGPNLINMFLNMPQAHVDAVNYWADSWAASGNWWVYSQDNILGWDRRNPAMAWSMVDLLLPIPALSKPYGEAVQWWMAANLPMHAGCSGLPPCPNYMDMLNSMFRVGGWEFYDADGYTFGPDGYTPEYEPVSENEGHWGYELGEDGDPVPWYGETVKLDPFAGWQSLFNNLLEDPQPLKFPTFDETMDAYVKFGAALVTMFNPFVPQSYLWNPRYSALAWILRPFATILCPQCNPYDPFMPVDWRPGDPVPKPVDDGWTPYDGDTPTGLPLPTGETNVSLLAAEQDDAGDLKKADTLDSTANDLSKKTDLPEALEAIEAKAGDLLTNPLGTVTEEKAGEEAGEAKAGDLLTNPLGTVTEEKAGEEAGEQSGEEKGGQSGTGKGASGTGTTGGTTTPAKDETEVKDANPAGPKHAKPARPSDTVKSIQDRINSSLSKGVKRAIESRSSAP